jgi:hypothetical protein
LGRGASKGQPVIRSIAASNYNATAKGLSGVSSRCIMHH